MLKVKNLSTEQKERLMQKLIILRKMNDNGLDIIGFTMKGRKIDFYAKAERPSYEPSVFPFTMYTAEPEFYENMCHEYQNQQEQ